MRVGILVVSDRRARGEAEDRTGPALREAVRASGWTVAAERLVPDEREAIGRTLVAWIDGEGLDLVLTAGGTGLGPRDLTPEVTRALLDRELPGIPELVRAEGRRENPGAVLTRGLAGARGGSLVLNLPGSPAGAAGALRAAAPVLEHASEVLRGAGHLEAEAPGGAR